RVGAAARRIGYAPLAGILFGCAVFLVLVLGLTSIEAQHLFPRQYVEEAQTGGPASAATESLLDRAGRVGGSYAVSGLRDVLISVGGGQREQALADRIKMHYLPAGFGAAIAAVVVVGTWRALRTRALSPSALLFQLIYVGALLAWVWVDYRYLYPVQPLL